jgi:hypothetical protein
MRFAGRGYTKPLISTTATAAGVTFRADCGLNPEAWAELHLSRADLEDALRQTVSIESGDMLAMDDDLGPDDPTPLEVEGVPGAVVPVAEE